MAGPRLTPILKRHEVERHAFVVYRRCATAMFQIVFLLVAAILLIVAFQRYLVKFPFLFPVLPVAMMLCLAMITPLVLYLLYQDDFREVEPLNPMHYIYLCRVAIRAFSQNQWKVASKDL
eukprot:jgi/Botrbrau1/18451/Bobra.0072s0034.1